MFVISLSTFFEIYLMSAPSRKSASFELALPHKVPKLNELAGRSFNQIRTQLLRFLNIGWFIYLVISQDLGQRNGFAGRWEYSF